MIDTLNKEIILSIYSFTHSIVEPDFQSHLDVMDFSWMVTRIFNFNMFTLRTKVMSSWLVWRYNYELHSSTSSLGSYRQCLADWFEDQSWLVLHLLQPLFQVVKEGVLRLKHLLDRGLVLDVSLREVRVDLPGEGDSVVHLQLLLQICSYAKHAKYV